MERIMSAAAERKLMQRVLLPVDSRKNIAIKREVQEYRVEADAGRFADAFRKALTDPEGTFGLIRVKRPADRMGKSFEPGERFQGCFSLEEVIGRRFSIPGRRWLMRRLFAFWPIRRAIACIEDTLLSDYAVVDQLTLTPDTARGEIHTLRYCYLEGTPIAGSTTYFIEPRGGEHCLVRQILEYQEINGLALSAFQRFGLKFHDQAVHWQIQKAAALAGIQPPVGTIPAAYT